MQSFLVGLVWVIFVFIRVNSQAGAEQPWLTALALLFAVVMLANAVFAHIEVRRRRLEDLMAEQNGRPTDSEVSRQV